MSLLAVDLGQIVPMFEVGFLCMIVYFQIYIIPLIHLMNIKEVMVFETFVQQVRKTIMANWQKWAYPNRPL